MESVFLKIRNTTDDSYIGQELCNHSVAWAYVQEGDLEEFLAPKVDFHIYMETYSKVEI